MAVNSVPRWNAIASSTPRDLVAHIDQEREAKGTHTYLGTVHTIVPYEHGRVEITDGGPEGLGNSGATTATCTCADGTLAWTWRSLGRLRRGWVRLVSKTPIVR